MCAVFLLLYVGVEVALGGWIVTFMMRVRHGEPFASGMAATGFWLGITVGRVVLGFVTPRLGEKLAISVASSLFLFLGISCMLTVADLSHLLHRLGPHPLARSELLRFDRGRLAAGVLPRAAVPCRRGRGDQVAAAWVARHRDWLCGGLWSGRWLGAAVCCWSHCAGKGCQGVAAVCHWLAWGDYGVVDVLATDSCSA